MHASKYYPFETGDCGALRITTQAVDVHHASTYKQQTP